VEVDAIDTVERELVLVLRARKDVREAHELVDKQAPVHLAVRRGVDHEELAVPHRGQNIFVVPGVGHRDPGIVERVLGDVGVGGQVHSHATNLPCQPTP
jgi:hypothetical protein